jgi:8-oxo-dGTP pyrophosphatase MutT (NUDIX family)
MPRIVSEIVEVYVYRLVNGWPEFLLLKRATGAAVGGTWQVVLGHMHPGETAEQCALRETREETGLSVAALHQLESVNTFFVAREDTIHLCPGFAARVAPNASVVLDAEHTEAAWLARAAATQRLMWPGQHRAIAEIIELILPGGIVADTLRLS